MDAQAPTVEVTYRRPPDSLPWQRIFTLVFASRLVLGIMTVLFIVTGLLVVFGHFIIYDEGLLTYVFARWLVLDPIPVLFFQKIKPVACVLYAIPSLGGIEVTLATHVVLAALAAPMLAAVARTLDIRIPNLPALIVLVSPLFLVGAAVGISNVDGVVAITLFLYLAIARRSYWLAGVVLGCLPWLRSELAPFSIVMWLYMTLVERNRGVTLGAMIFPVLYGISGAAYHRDLFWLLHFPPTASSGMSDNPIWGVQKIGAGYLLAVLLQVTPTIGLAVAVRARRLSPVEVALLVFAALSLVLLSVLPFVGLGNFGPVARYSMQPLPVLALLVARVVEPWVEGRRASWRLYLLPAALAAIWAVSHGPPAMVAVPILAAYLAIAVLASRGWGRAAACAVALAAGLGLALPRDEMRTPSLFTPALAWLNDHPREVHGATIYTNSPVMPFGIASAANLVDTDVRFIVAPDTMWEIIELSNPENGQRDALQRIARAELFGPSVSWSELSPDSMPPKSLFLLRQDPRTPSVMPDAVWAGRLDRIGGDQHFTVARVVPAGSAAARPGSSDSGAP